MVIAICIYEKIVLILRVILWAYVECPKKMAEEIRHEGVIEEIDGAIARVRIARSSACAGCQAKAMCKSTAEGQEHVVEATFAGDFRVGEHVEVTESRSMGWKAVVLAYLMPVVVLVAVLGCLNMVTTCEAITGTVALCAAGVYFIVLSFFRGRLQKHLSFQVRKKE